MLFSAFAKGLQAQNSFQNQAASCFAFSCNIWILVNLQSWQPALCSGKAGAAYCFPALGQRLHSQLWKPNQQKFRPEEIVQHLAKCAGELNDLSLEAQPCNLILHRFLLHSYTGSCWGFPSLQSSFLRNWQLTLKFPPHQVSFAMRKTLKAGGWQTCHCVADKQADKPLVGIQGCDAGSCITG